MIPTIEQSKQWNDEAIAYLKENEFEWVTVGIEEEYNRILIFPNNLPPLDEFPNAVEMQGGELFCLIGKAQFILMKD